MAKGYLDIQHPISTIRHDHHPRKDIGDLDELCASIRQVGLLHPVVISPEELLISGRRRLEAVRLLGWHQVPTWIATGVSTQLLIVLATQHEHATRKNLTPTESAELYAELKALYAEDAARRQQATRFGSTTTADPGESGGGDSTGPQPAVAAMGGGRGETSRAQAARAITGRDSHGMLEQVLELKAITERDDIPEWLRAETEKALADLDEDGKVNGRYVEIKSSETRHELEQAATNQSLPETTRQLAKTELAQLDRLTSPAAVAREGKRAKWRLQKATNEGWADAAPEARMLLSARRFSGWVDKHYGWWNSYRPEDLALGLNDEQWVVVEAAFDATSAFIAEVRTARQQASDHSRTTDPKN